MRNPRDDTHLPAVLEGDLGPQVVTVASLAAAATRTESLAMARAAVVRPAIAHGVVRAVVRVAGVHALDRDLVVGAVVDVNRVRRQVATAQVLVALLVEAAPAGKVLVAVVHVPDAQPLVVPIVIGLTGVHTEAALVEVHAPEVERLRCRGAVAVRGAEAAWR